MKKSLLALAVLGAVAGAAQAQTAVTIYGQIDIGIVKTKNQTTALGRGDNNKLGFKGVEDLGGGLSALFQLEMRYEPDTGTTEAAPNRPLFQGQTRVGLKGDFGTIRLGRGLTAFQEVIGNFEPWSFDSNRANLVTFSTANYNGDPLSPGSSQNRWSNAIWYNSPVFSGFQANFTVASKESLGAPPAATPTTPTVNAYSTAFTYNNGPLAAELSFERNAIETKLLSVGASYQIVPDWKLMGTFAQQKAGVGGLKTKGWVLGSQYKIGQGVLLAGYGRNQTDGTLNVTTGGVIGTPALGTTGIPNTTQWSLGYEYNLSKRTFLYADWFTRKSPNTANGSVAGSTSSTNSVDLGINHRF